VHRSSRQLETCSYCLYNNYFTVFPEPVPSWQHGALCSVQVSGHSVCFYQLGHVKTVVYHGDAIAS